MPTVESITSNVFEDDSADNDIIINRPSGTASGDFLVAAFHVENGISMTLSASGGATWTELDYVTGTNVQGSIFYKFAGDSEPATYTFSKNQTFGSVLSVGILRISGVDTDSPIDGFDTATGSTATPTCPDITTGVDGTLVLRFFGQDDDHNPVSVPAGHTQHWHENTTLGFDMTVGAASIAQADPGATGTGVFTNSTGGGWLAWTVALSPAPSIDVVDTQNDLQLPRNFVPA